MSDIQIVHTYNKTHALGWSQDASDFTGMKKVVYLFDESSDYHDELVNVRIPDLVEDPDLARTFIDELNKTPVRITYRLLVGTHSTPRSSSPCSGIVQAAVPGQKRPYLSDWAADSVLCWAHLCGFIKYNGEDETFEITDEGLKLSKTKDGSEEERQILITALLRYPPVSRILDLLSDGEHLTKFELGRQLGFVGEDGFTSLPQNVLLNTLASTDDKSEKNKMRSDWDGSSDKYARQICSWLEKLGLVKRMPKEFSVCVDGEDHQETIGQAYQITAEGLKAYRRTRGINKVKREPKNVFWEMLCTKGKDKNYIRDRRAYIIKFMSSASSPVSLTRLKERLEGEGINDPETTIADDIDGLINIGLNVKEVKDGFVLAEDVQSLIIPDPKTNRVSKSDTTYTKEACGEVLKQIPHHYLDLIDLAFDPKSNRQFEMEVIDLMTSECGYKGQHLGGQLRPDGVLYTEGLSENYGTIVDTKAYSNGYSLPQSQADEMDRYVEQNNKRDPKLCQNEWWTAFPDDLKRFNFAFVSGKFVGNVQNRLEYIANDTGVNGGAIGVLALLYVAEGIKEQYISLEEAYNMMTENTVVF